MLSKIDFNIDEWDDLEEDVRRERQPSVSIKKEGGVVFNGGIQEILRVDKEDSEKDHSRFDELRCKGKDILFILSPTSGIGDSRRKLKLRKVTGSKNEKTGSFTMKVLLKNKGIIPLPQEVSNKGDGEEWTSINFTEGDGLYVDHSEERTVLQLKFEEGEGKVNKPVPKEKKK